MLGYLGRRLTVEWEGVDENCRRRERRFGGTEVGEQRQRAARGAPIMTALPAAASRVGK